MAKEKQLDKKKKNKNGGTGCAKNKLTVLSSRYIVFDRKSIPIVA